MKIEIRNRWTNAVIFTHEADGATMRDAVQKAHDSGANLSGAELGGANLRGAELIGADLRDADLRDADLSCANLSGAELSGAELRDADLRGANLSCANLTPIRDDIWAVLSSAPREVPALIDALKAGRVDGSTYSGECSCLIGTIARTRATAIENLGSLKPNSSRPAECFFMGICKGDTPETNQFSALALQWSQEWLDNMRAAFALAS